MKKEQILGIVRQVLTFVGMFLVSRGLGDESLTQEIIGAITAGVATAWGIYDKTERGLSAWYSLLRHVVSALGGFLLLIEVPVLDFEQISGAVLGLMGALMSFEENRK